MSETEKQRRRYYSPFLGSDANNQHSPAAAALIILNTPIPANDNDNSYKNVFQILWESTSFHICADGGANRLYDATITTTTGNNSDTFIPDLITGDLDSMRPDVRSYYESKGVEIVRVEDQNYHDLDKSLFATEAWLNKLTTTTTRTFIYGGFGGRFDQEMACINTLYSWGRKEAFQHTQMSIFNEETGVILLPEDPVVNEIMIRFPGMEDDDDDDVGVNKSDQIGVVVGEGPTCGLIPIGGRCEEVYTTGLKWNLDGDMPLEFGGLVSSSNRIIERLVTVKTSSPLLFSFEIVQRSSK